MLRFRQQSDDRRRGYSFRRHFARLRQEGRLPQIALAAVAVMIVGGITFGRCQGDSITGPSAPAAEGSAPTAVATSTSGSVAPTTAPGPADAVPPPFRENTVERNAMFTGVNPCNGEPVVARGRRHDRLS